MAGRGGGMGWRLAVGLLCLWAGPASARALAGVEVPEVLYYQDRPLVLAHAELHEVLFLDLYVWALYLEHPPRSNQEAVSTDEFKQLRLHFRRPLRREQLVQAFRDFLRGSDELRSKEMSPYLQELVQSLRGVRKGDRLLITYLPGRGLYVSGEASGGTLIPGKAFADALFTRWLREHPVFDHDQAPAHPHSQ